MDAGLALLFDNASSLVVDLCSCVRFLSAFREVFLVLQAGPLFFCLRALLLHFCTHIQELDS